MPTESAKVRLDEFVGGLTVFQIVSFFAVAATATSALWTWRDGLISERTTLQTHLIQAEARTNSLAESLARAEAREQLLQQTNHELRADVARQSGQDSRTTTCAFIQKQIAAVNADLSVARNPLLVYSESKESGEERTRHLAHLADQLRTLTVSLEACAR
jgi:hypothetical protein